LFDLPAASPRAPNVDPASVPAVTQRRLGGFLPPIHFGFPSPGRFWAIAALVGAAAIVVAVAFAVTRATGPSNPFIGTWTATDLDGSAETLTITGGTDVQLTYIDRYAPGGCKEAAEKTLTSTLAGHVSGQVLQATFVSVHCGATAVQTLVGQSFTWTYDPGKDTISGAEVTWHRS
jgi:hypothetical protein